MEEVEIDLSPAQIRKLKKGQTIQLKPAMIGKGMKVPMKAHKAKRIHSAARRSKGVRLSMDEDEIEAGRITWGDLKRGLKKAWRGYKKYVKPVAAPIIKKGLQIGVEKGSQALAAYTGQPEIAILGKIAAEKGVPALGRVTGAYGMKRAVVPNTSMVSNFLPAANPLLQYGDLYYGSDLMQT